MLFSLFSTLTMSVLLLLSVSKDSKLSLEVILLNYSYINSKQIKIKAYYNNE